MASHYLSIVLSVAQEFCLQQISRKACVAIYADDRQGFTVDKRISTGAVVFMSNAG